MIQVRQLIVQPVGVPRTWTLPAGAKIEVNPAPGEALAVAVIGPQGPTGAPGAGIPHGGSQGQVLVKSGGEDFETQWVSMDLSSLTQTIDGGNF